MSNADVYGFSCYIWNIETVLKLCKILKKLRPERKIFLGGPEVSFDSTEVLTQNPFVDYIVCGEGERAVADLIKMPPFERCVLYGERLENMNLLPFPALDRYAPARLRPGHVPGFRMVRAFLPAGHWLGRMEGRHSRSRPWRSDRPCGGHAGGLSAQRAAGRHTQGPAWL